MFESVKRYNGTGAAPTIFSSHFRGLFKYDLVIIPLDTPFAVISSSASCLVSEAVDSGGYCGINFGFGIAPRPPVKAAFASQGMRSTAGGVPEPASWAMMVAGFGVVGLGGGRSRRRGRGQAVTA